MTRPAVLIDHTFVGSRLARSWARNRLPVHPHRSSAYQNGHLELSIPWAAQRSSRASYLFKNRSRAPAILRETSEGTATRRQTNDLHVSIVRAPQSFLWLRPLRHSSPSFGSDRHARTRTFSEDQGRSAVQPQGDPQSASLRLTGLIAVDSHTCQTPWSTGRMGSSQADAGSGSCRSTPVRARCRHDRVDGVSSGVSTARALAARNPRRSTPEPIGGPAVTFHIRPGRIAAPSASSRQFQALFDSLFKVLFIFPREFTADWGCIPNNRLADSASWCDRVGHNGALTLSGATSSGLGPVRAEDASPDYNSNADGARFSSWAVPGSLAVTRGILVTGNPLTWGRVESSAEARAASVAGRSERDESAQLATEVRRPPIVVAFVAEDPAFVPTARGDAREAIVRPPRRSRGMRGGATACDAQAGVPSA
ncbi:hypothetical protein DVH24_031520 [Malus domestica]|uniref:Uncharacterized protein n=1 Tax=Malus domestica TaxID=3750 RepID=A0A498KYE7_MALDO|nr:hypothetical protein DVH24_031520 [Malus domestica]